jgi:hypothetical protein
MLRVGVGGALEFFLGEVILQLLARLEHRNHPVSKAQGPAWSGFVDGQALLSSFLASLLCLEFLGELNQPTPDGRVVGGELAEQLNLALPAVLLFGARGILADKVLLGGRFEDWKGKPRYARDTGKLLF